MRRQRFALVSVLLLLSLLPACRHSPDNEHQGSSKSAGETRDVLYYTCSMHTFIREAKPGRCPVCGMELVPIFADAGGAADHPHPEAGGVEGRAPVSLSTDKIQISGVKTESIARRHLIREIEAPGRVAYDPGLYVAQSDFLIARRTGGGDLGGMQGGLVSASRARLRLLGMSETQIRELERRGHAQAGLVVPDKGEQAWIYVALFESDFAFIQAGSAVEVSLPNSNKTLSSNIVSIDPVINPETRTAQARFPLSNSDGELRPDMYLKVRVKADLGEVLAVPSSAILDTGKRQLVYLQVDPGRFAPREIKTGRRGNDYLEILSGLSDGDTVVTTGAFLVDSESSLKADIGASDGGHPH